MNFIATKSQNGPEPVLLHSRVRTLERGKPASPPMKTSTRERRSGESASGDARQKRLGIQPWQTARFTQTILIRAQGRSSQHDFREAHNTRMRNVRACLRTRPVIRRANELRAAPTDRASVRFPAGFSPREKQVLKHTTP
jgi:hypothetical protein